MPKYLKKEDQWNSFNVLNSNVGRINALELGITSKKPNDLPPAKVVYLLGAYNFRHEEIPEVQFAWWRVQGEVAPKPPWWVLHRKLGLHS